jgi:hypothetical protein
VIRKLVALLDDHTLLTIHEPERLGKINPKGWCQLYAPKPKSLFADRACGRRYWRSRN